MRSGRLGDGRPLLDGDIGVTALGSAVGYVLCRVVMRILVGHLVSFLWADTAIFTHGSDTPDW